MRRVRANNFFVTTLIVAAVVFTLSPRGDALASAPWFGPPQTLPGTILAADFDAGGAGVAFGDTTAGNSGGAYRQTDVDIEASSEGTFDVGWVDAGEWLNYTVSTTTAGNYVASLRVASPAGGGSLHLGFNGPSSVWSAVSIPATGGWQTWATVDVPVTLGAGQQQMTILFDTPGINLESIEVRAAGTTTTQRSPFAGMPVTLPGVIQAANFDEGGSGVSYADSTPGNSGGAYRNTDVDVEPSSLGGYDVGWISAGEWLNYTVNVTAPGSYSVAVRVASPGGGASMHLGFNGATNVWQPLTISGTGGWQNWTTITTLVTLAAGTQQLTIHADTAGFNLASISVQRELTSAVPALSHVYVILLENKEASSVIGGQEAPYMNALAAQYGLSTAYTGITHPSLPNYMALTGGDTFFSDDCIGCIVDAPNIADSLEQSGHTWRAYMEDMPAPCGQTDTGSYVAKHNPFVHYASIAYDVGRCTSHVVPLTSFGSDLSAGAMPGFIWITPNLCNDMHDCDVATGDRWLASIVPQILGAPDFENSVLFITFDEGTSTTGGGGVVPLLVISPRGLHVASSQPANHYDLLRTIADLLRTAPVGRALNARPLTEFFAP